MAATPAQRGGPAYPTGSRATGRWLWLLRLLTAAALAVDAYVHLQEASIYDQTQPGASVSQGQLFRVESAVAIAAAVLVLAWRRRSSWLLALLVAASALAAVLLSRYVDIGGVGPLPDMYEPTWAAGGKLPSAVAEAAATAAALVGLLLQHRVLRGARPAGSPRAA